jgi:hypothetical protein
MRTPKGITTKNVVAANQAWVRIIASRWSEEPKPEGGAPGMEDIARANEGRTKKRPVELREPKGGSFGEYTHYPDCREQYINLSAPQSAHRHGIFRASCAMRVRGSEAGDVFRHGLTNHHETYTYIDQRKNCRLSSNEENQSEFRKAKRVLRLLQASALPLLDDVMLLNATSLRKFRL